MSVDCFCNYHGSSGKLDCLFAGFGLQSSLNVVVITVATRSRFLKLFPLQEKTKQASQFCERVNTRRTVKSLETEIIQKTRRIQTEEKKYVQCSSYMLFAVILYVHVCFMAIQFFDVGANR